MQAVPLTFLVIGTLGILLFGATLTPVLDDRAAVTIRLRIIALVLFAVGMVTFAVTTIAVG
jgi:quinol-cytochrome oxidoreductase complex cytochrome b subunit